MSSNILVYAITYRVAGQVYSDLIVTTPAKLRAMKLCIAYTAASLQASEGCPVRGTVHWMPVGWG